MPPTNKAPRKKTARACVHCHKSHMTCDSNRPCNRCVSKGLQATCVDAPRKKKKYLLDIEESIMSNSMSPKSGTLMSSSGESGSNNNTISLAPSGSSMSQSLSMQSIPTVNKNVGRHNNNNIIIDSKDQYENQSNNLNNTFDNSVVDNNNNKDNGLLPLPTNINNQETNQPVIRKRNPRFSSAAADLEYAVLTSIIKENPLSDDGSLDFLGTMNLDQLNYNVPNFSLFHKRDNNLNNGSSPDSIKNYSDTPTPPSIGSPSNGNGLAGHARHSFTHALKHHQNHHHHHHHNNINSNNNNNKNSNTVKSNNSHPMDRSASSGASLTYDIYPQWDPLINQYFLGPLPGLPDSKPYLTYPDICDVIEKNCSAVPMKDPKCTLSFAIGVHSDNPHHRHHYRHDTEWGLRFKEPEEIYSQVKSPFSYTTGFHLLVVYLRKRFDDDKTVLVKLAKSMAQYRPSFTAQVMTLKEGDLIFMEQCFQRTLLEYTRYISISGTPTAIWRRTGQISFVSEEFTMLTGWTTESLLSKITFIVELMDDISVIEYFELFSKIAYEDSKGAGTTNCRLTSMVGDKSINTRCIWTLKRDVFGIPMMIIGNFLPILN